MDGRLHWFIGVPPQREPPGIGSAEPDWSVPFREAGLDLANFRQVASISVPLHAYDKRAAWDGIDPGPQASMPGGPGTGVSTHVEAASFRGRLVYFETIYPWDRPVREEEPTQSGKGRALTFILISIYMIVLISSVLLARKNLKLGRGDRRGATRLALLFLIIGMLKWLFTEHHNWAPLREFGIFIISLAQTVYNAVYLWLLYVALEPFVRKRWPKRIISWSRLMAGGFRDPLVGRDILIGAAVAASIILLEPLTSLMTRWIGHSPELTLNPGTVQIGSHLLIHKLTAQLSSGIFLGFITLFILLLLFVVVRRERLAFGILWLLLTVVSTLLGQTSLQLFPLTALGAFLPVYVLYRSGLLAAVATFFFTHLMIYYPITTQLTAWYATDFAIALLICLALAAYAFYTSLGGQKVFSGKMLEE
jgi:serine/threonine-protein kinase